MTLWQQVAEASPKDGRGHGVLGDIGEYKRRDEFILNFGFAVPTPAAINDIKHFVGQRKLLEVGAGTGLWARLLSDAGVKVTAVDNNSGDYRSAFKIGAHFPVEELDGAKAVKKCRDHEALMLCWPDYDDSMAARALKAFRGDHLIYIGEGDGGCTGDKVFHRAVERSWDEVATFYIPQWPGIHDYIMLYRRRK